MPCRQDDDDDDDLDDVSNLAPTPTFPPTFFSSLVESSSLIGMLPKFCLSPSLCFWPLPPTAGGQLATNTDGKEK